MKTNGAKQVLSKMQSSLFTKLKNIKDKNKKV